MTSALFPDYSVHCVFDSTRTYRYIWSYELGVYPARPPRRLMFVGLNPSKADEYVLDNTVRKLIGWTRDWGFSALDVANAYAYRSTDPRNLKHVADPIGPENDRYIIEVAERASLHLVGWGRHATLLDRGRKVAAMLARFNPVCLHINADGSPGHPLYLPNATKPVPYQIPV